MFPGKVTKGKQKYNSPEVEYKPVVFLWVLQEAVEVYLA